MDKWRGGQSKEQTEEGMDRGGKGDTEKERDRKVMDGWRVGETKGERDGQREGPKT